MHQRFIDKYRPYIKEKPLIDNIRPELLVRIQNVIYTSFYEKLDNYIINKSALAGGINYMFKELWVEYLNYDVRKYSEYTYHYKSQNFINIIDDAKKNWAWFNWIAYVEDIWQVLEKYKQKKNYEWLTIIQILFADKINKAFQYENSGYRLVNGRIAEIIDQVEIDEINSVFSIKDKYQAAKEHINKALNLMADKKNPDYKNSIKESISAVESVCKVITGKHDVSLSVAIKEIESNSKLNKVLKDGFIKIYGYTSNEKGVRHAAIDDSDTVTYSDAKFMLVACSAFVNYLIMKNEDI